MPKSASLRDRLRADSVAGLAAEAARSTGQKDLARQAQEGEPNQLDLAPQEDENRVRDPLGIADRFVFDPITSAVKEGISAFQAADDSVNVLGELEKNSLDIPFGEKLKTGLKASGKSLKEAVPKEIRELGSDAAQAFKSLADLVTPAGPATLESGAVVPEGQLGDLNLTGAENIFSAAELAELNAAETLVPEVGELSLEGLSGQLSDPSGLTEAVDAGLGVVKPAVATPVGAGVEAVAPAAGEAAAEAAGEAAGEAAAEAAGGAGTAVGSTLASNVLSVVGIAKLLGQVAQNKNKNRGGLGGLLG